MPTVTSDRGALAQVVAPVSVPYRFGLFSVVTPRAEEGHWRFGIEMRSRSCGSTRKMVDPCFNEDADQTVIPLDNSCVVNSFAPFAVYGFNDESVGSATPDEAEAAARELLLSGEQELVESELWALLAAEVTEVALGAETAALALGMVEQLLAQSYGNQGVIHMNRLTATLLATELHAEGGKLVTVLGTPVVAGGGYGEVTTEPTSASIYGTGPLVMYRGAISETGFRTLDRRINSYSDLSQRDYVLGWDCTAVGVTVDI